MRILTLLIFAGFLLFSCQKEAGTPDNGNVNPPPPPPPPPPADTTALGRFVTAAGITDAQTKVNLDSLSGYLRYFLRFA